MWRILILGPKLATYKSSANGIFGGDGEDATRLLDVWSGIIELDRGSLLRPALLHPAHSDTVYARYFDIRRYVRPLKERRWNSYRNPRCKDLIH